LTTSSPILRIPNVVKGYVCSSDLKYSVLTEKEENEYALQQGDLLVIRSNGSLNIVGSCAVVDKNHEGFCYAGYLVRVRLSHNFYNSNFLKLVLSSALIRRQIELPIRSTSGVKNINSTEISQLVMPIVPMKEQVRIVEKVEQLTTLCNQFKESLILAQQTQLHLADAIVEKAL